MQIETLDKGYLNHINLICFWLSSMVCLQFLASLPTISEKKACLAMQLDVSHEQIWPSDPWSYDNVSSRCFSRTSILGQYFHQIFKDKYLHGYISRDTSLRTMCLRTMCFRTLCNRVIRDTITYHRTMWQRSRVLGHVSNDQLSHDHVSQGKGGNDGLTTQEFKWTMQSISQGHFNHTGRSSLFPGS